MSQADAVITTDRRGSINRALNDGSSIAVRNPNNAAIIGMMLLRAILVGPNDYQAPVESAPDRPVLAGGAAGRVEEIA